MFSFVVGCADDLAGLHAATGNQNGHGLRPMITTGLHDAGLGTSLDRDARCATEFACRDEQHFAIKPSLVEIFDERAQSLIVSRQPPLTVLEDVSVDRVRIPIVSSRIGRGFARERMLPNHGHESDASFHEAAS